MKLSKKFTVEPDKSFTQLYVLWFGVILIVSFSIAVGVTILCHENLSFELDGDGFNNFVQIYKFPLGILTLVITYIAFIATTHRSVQAKEQIEATGKQIQTSLKQNNFANYYKHIEEFEKYLMSLNLTGNEKHMIPSTNLLYNRLYPFSKNGDYSLEPYIENSLTSLEVRFHELFTYLTDGFKLDQNLLKEFADNIDCVFRTLGLNPARNGKRINIGDEMYVFDDLTLRGYLSSLKSKSSDLLKSINFEQFKTDTHYILMISLINLECIPHLDFQYLGEGSKN